MQTSENSIIEASASVLLFTQCFYLH